LAKRKTKKQVKSKGKPLKRGFPWFGWLAVGLGTIAIFAIIIFVVTRPSSTSEPASAVDSSNLRAAIVDQLQSVHPNQLFISDITQKLRDYGFQVDIYKGDDVTVDLYRKLPSYGYEMIIFRVHSGLLVGSESVAKKIWMFTSEPYSRTRYLFRQLNNQVANAATQEDNVPVFAVSAKFITQGTEGQFADTAIIMMGCAGFESDNLAQAFIQKGASTYLAWDASVGLSYVDDATATLIENLCTNKMTIVDAVADTMNKKGPDPGNNALLHYYPQASANKTLSQLIE